MNKMITLLMLCILPIYSQTGNLKYYVSPYIQNMTSDAVTVLWETNMKCIGEVDFGKAEFNKKTPELTEKKKETDQGLMHVVELKNLQRGTKYFYRVKSYSTSNDTLESEIIPFRTFPDENEPFTFAVFGDSQQQDDTLVWKRISDLAFIERPQFGIIVGDLVDQGDMTYMWRDQFLANANEFMKSIPLFPAMGNHDNEDPNFFKYMKSNNSRSYYTFKYGNTQYFILDSNLDLERASSQFTWLEEELARSKSLWKIVVHHHPVYSSDEDDYGNTNTSLSEVGEPLFKPIIPLYEKYNVDLVFYGHIHSYERTYPILENQVDNNGVIYIQTGGAGGNLEKAGIIRNWFTAKVKSEHHFCLVSINGKELVFNAIDYKGNQFDYMKLEKNNKSFTSIAAPVIKSKSEKFIESVSVEIKDFNENSEIRYTLDKSTPNMYSTLYTCNLEFENSTTLKARVFCNEIGSKVSTAEFTKIDAEKPVEYIPRNKGLIFNYYTEGDWSNLPDFSKIHEEKSGVTKFFDISGIKEKDDKFGITFNGFIEIKVTDVYEFSVYSDDGAKLYIDDKLLVDNDGSHSPRRKSASIGLQKGYHKFYLEYFDDTEGEILEVTYKSEQLPKQVIPEGVYFN